MLILVQDNLCNLLTPEEQDSIYNVFCSVDIDRDASLKLKEYLNYKQRVCQLKQNRNLTPEEKTLEEEQFDHLDVDGSGELEYWEFMKNEAALKLKERGEVSIPSRHKTLNQFCFNVGPAS